MNNGTIFYNELLALLNRYSQESDITSYEIIGALEAVKADILDRLKKQNGGN